MSKYENRLVGKFTKHHKVRECSIDHLKVLFKLLLLLLLIINCKFSWLNSLF